MKKYGIFDPDGNMVQDGHCPDEAVSLQARNRPAGYTSREIPAHANQDEHKLVDGNIVACPSHEVEAKRKKLRDAENAPRPKPDKLDKVLRILRHLKAHGIDLGPDGADL